MQIVPDIFSSFQNSLYNNARQFQNAANQIVSSTTVNPLGPASDSSTSSEDPLLASVSRVIASSDQMRLDYLLLHSASHKLDILYQDLFVPPHNGFSTYA